MVKIFFFLIFLILTSCVNDKESKSHDLINNPISAQEKNKNFALEPKIELKNDVYDFGEITQGDFVDIEFIVKNIGNAPLLIRKARGSCGCTVPEWPKDPIMEGNQAIIKVRFNSEGKKGFQNKKVTLITNSIPSTRVLTIKGNIII